MSYCRFYSDPTFDIEAEMDVVGVGSMTPDVSGFDISNVYEPGGASTSSTSGIFFVTYASHMSRSRFN